MNIIVSGGWGYGNIGDDVILDSQIYLINSKYPDANITVLTYDKNDSCCHKNVVLEKGLHAIIDNKTSRIRFDRYNSNYQFLLKLKHKLINKLLENKYLFKFQLFIKGKSITELEEIIKRSDVFIMSGGGYYNEKWKAKIRSQALELTLANKHGLKTYILGPTIGHLNAEMTSISKSIFENATAVSIRDEASLKEVKKLGVDPILIPDIALSKSYTGDSDFNKLSKLNEVGIVYTSSSKIVLDKVIYMMKYLSQENNIKIKLILTRLWKNDLKMVKVLQKTLSENDIRSEIIISSDHVMLEESLYSCSLVISENLHGMITAARNLVPIISINNYEKGSPNYKKIVSFLSQLDVSSNQISENTSYAEIDTILAGIVKDTKYKDRVSDLVCFTNRCYLDLL